MLTPPPLDGGGNDQLPVGGVALLLAGGDMSTGIGGIGGIGGMGAGLGGTDTDLMHAGRQPGICNSSVDGG